MNSKALAVGCVLIVVAIAACLGAIALNDSGDSDKGTSEIPGGNTPDQEIPADSRILVVYFSKTGTTESYAREISSMLNADIVEIQPVIPYPDSYNETIQIAQQEKNDNVRPEIQPIDVDMTQYDVVLVGYPIWYRAPPMAVLTFLESFDFTGKTMINFATSGSSPISETSPYFESSIPGATFIQGDRLTGSNASASFLERVGLTVSS